MQADLFGTKKQAGYKSGELPIPTFTYHLPLRGESSFRKEENNG